MKKFKLIILAVLALFILVACNNENDDPPRDETPSGTEVVDNSGSEINDDDSEIIENEVAANFDTDHVPVNYFTFGDTFDWNGHFEITVGSAPIFNDFDYSVLPEAMVRLVEDENVRELYINRARNYIDEARPMITVPVVVRNIAAVPDGNGSFFLPALARIHSPAGNHRHRSALWLTEINGNRDFHTFHPYWVEEETTFNVTFWDDGDGYYVVHFAESLRDGVNPIDLVFRISR